MRMTRPEAARIAWAFARLLDNERTLRYPHHLALRLTQESTLLLATALDVLAEYADPLPREEEEEPEGVPRWLAREKRRKEARR